MASVFERGSPCWWDFYCAQSHRHCRREREFAQWSYWGIAQKPPGTFKHSLGLGTGDCFLLKKEQKQTNKRPSCYYSASATRCLGPYFDPEWHSLKLKRWSASNLEYTVWNDFCSSFLLAGPVILGRSRDTPNIIGRQTAGCPVLHWVKSAFSDVSRCFPKLNVVSLV